MHRLFVAIRPPQDVRDRLIDAMDEGPELRWVAEENLHLTLRFIGEVERPLAEDVAAALGGIRADGLDVRVSGVGQFERRSGGALWAGVQPREPLAALAAKVDRACQSAGIEAERRAFHPHITIARYNRQSRVAAQDFLERNRGLDAGSFTADRLLLFESHLSRHDPTYEVVAAYRLE